MLEREEVPYIHRANIANTVSTLVEHVPHLEIDNELVASISFDVLKHGIIRFFLENGVPAFTTATMHHFIQWNELGEIALGTVEESDGQCMTFVEVSLQSNTGGVSDCITHKLILPDDDNNRIETYWDRYDLDGSTPYDGRLASDKDIRDFSIMVSGIADAVEYINQIR